MAGVIDHPGHFNRLEIFVFDHEYPSHVQAPMPGLARAAGRWENTDTAKAGRAGSVARCDRFAHQVSQGDDDRGGPVSTSKMASGRMASGGVSCPVSDRKPAMRAKKGPHRTEPERALARRCWGGAGRSGGGLVCSSPGTPSAKNWGRTKGSGRIRTKAMGPGGTAPPKGAP